MPFADIIHTQWERKFAWWPVRSRSGRWLWLRTVLHRQTEVNYRTLAITKIVTEYSTPQEIFLEQIRGTGK